MLPGPVTLLGETEKKALDQHPVVSTVECGGWDREGPLFSLLLVSSRMKVQEAYSTSRGWLPFSSASGLSPQVGF